MEFITFDGTLKELSIEFNAEGWGPQSGEKMAAFEDVPYAHFDKKDKLWRAADFTQQANTNQRTYNRRREEPANAEFAYKHDAVEDSTFRLVDTSRSTTKKQLGPKRNWSQPNRGRGGKFNTTRPGAARNEPQTTNTRTTKKGARGRGGRTQGRRTDRKNDRQPSLAVHGDWEVIEEFDLPQLLKLVANPPKVEDIVWCGHLDQYDDTYDKLTSKIARPLRRVENKHFFSVTTEDDPVIERVAAEGIGNVFATDAIIAQLMAAPRSIYSWDIVIQKMNGMIFLDKRDDSQFDLLTVSETAHEPPQASEDIPEINHPEKLSLEATMINQNFSQQVLKEASPETRKTYEPNPFFDESSEGEPASVAYRYRKFALGDVTLVARTEVHGYTNKRGEDQLMTCFALNEWDSKYAGGVEWRQKIDQQRGAVLVTELKNNSCKLAKWTAQSILSGVDMMKLGYVSRNSKTNAYEHSILATQFFKPKDLATQIALTLTNMWGIVKMICELLMRQEDGKYVLMKDPNKATLRLYSVPMNTFESDEDEEEEGDDEDGRSSDDDEH